MKYKILICAIWLLKFNSAYSEEEISSLSNGSCWYSVEDSMIKLSSFNEKTSLKKSFDDLNEEAQALIKNQFNFAQFTQIQPLDISLHCGAYGSSFVFKFDTNLGELCLWANTNGQKVGLRSLGVISKKDSSFCHGEKIGELILGIQDKEVIESLKSEKFNQFVSSIEYVALDTYKLNLKEAYYFKESEVIDYIRSNFDLKKLKYIEFNDFRHPIGDVVKLK